MWDKNVTINTYGFSRSHTVTGLVCVSLSILDVGHFILFKHPLKLCCLSSAVLYISVNVPQSNICLYVCLNLHPPADTFSFLYFYEPSVCHTDLFGHHHLHLFTYQANHDHFKICQSFQVRQFWLRCFRFYSLVQRFSTLII